MSTPGERLKKVREISGLTQETLGGRIGLRWSQVKDRETGVTKIDALLAKVLYYTFNISPDWLLHGKGEMLTGTGEEGATIPAEHRSYVDKLVAILNKGNREKVGRLKERIDIYFEEVQEREARPPKVEKRGA